MHVTVVAKSPVAGQVKTRLCPPLSPTQAADVAAAALADTLDGVDQALCGRDDVRTVLLLDGAPPSWVPGHWEIVPQRGVGLADRLANGFDDLGRGVVVGMDTPYAVGAVIDALPALERGLDAVGLADDGGYWAIGLCRPCAAVFAGVAMSTLRTGADQLDRLTELGREVVLLPDARDLDTYDDLVHLARTGHQGRATELARRLTSAWTARRPLVRR